MSNVTFNFGLLLKLGMYIFLPVVVLIFMSRMIILFCTRKIKRTDEEKYYRIINSWTSFVAIIITVALLIVTIVYAYYFIDTLKSRNLISRNRTIYYLVLAFPVIPFSFLIYYIVGLIRMREIHHDIKDSNQPSNDFSIENKSFYHDDYVQLPDTNSNDVELSQFELPVEDSEKSSSEDHEKNNNEIELL